MIEYLANFKKNSDAIILVIGDFMLDRYLWGKTDRISPESPIPVVHVQSENETLGGAGNVIANICGLGLKAIPVGVIGDDLTGEKIKTKLNDLGCELDGLIKTADRQTIEKTRVIAQNQQVVRIDYEENNQLSDTEYDNLKEFILQYLPNIDVVVLSDYGKGLCNREFVHFIIEEANKLKKNIIVDPKGKDYSKYSAAYCITPNEKEATGATGIEVKDEKSAQAAGRFIIEKYNVDNVILTRGKDGMTLIGSNGVKHLQTQAREVYDVSGAGDTVVSTLASSLSLGIDLETAMVIANSAAGIVVARIGTAPINLKELENFIISNGNSKAHVKILNQDELSRKVASWKSEGKSIVFTNGCFDLLHTGHISLLENAKSFGDKLIVGLNTDKSISRLKGDNRPIIKEFDRAKILSSLEFVDNVCFFDDDTPENLIKLIQPDYLVKGSDYSSDEIIGANYVQSYGGEVRCIPLVEGKSITNLINNIKSVEK